MFGDLKNETPSYVVILKTDVYEIRRYHKQFLAQNIYEVSKDTDFLSKISTVFYPLFQYISGNNDKNTKIGMTVPVIIQETGDDSSVKRTMSFIMSPSRFTSSDQLPRANDENIEIVEQANTHDMAYITFNMSMSTEKNTTKEKELREAAAQDGIQLSTNRNDVLYFGYNPPYTIPYFPRIKICIAIINQQ
jgi:hypothetical protein